MTATFDDGDSIRARYVVGADGIHSIVRERAGIGFDGSVYEESFVLADVRLTGVRPARRGASLFWATAGLTVVAPLPDGVHRIVAPVADAPETPSTCVRAAAARHPRRPGRLTVTDVVWGSRFRVHHRVADTYRAGRLLLAGDAAHVHSPAGGQGMNLGIQDAVALGDALAAVLGGAPDSVLDDYSAARRPIAHEVVDVDRPADPVGDAPPRRTPDPQRRASGWSADSLGAHRPGAQAERSGLPLISRRQAVTKSGHGLDLSTRSTSLFPTTTSTTCAHDWPAPDGRKPSASTTGARASHWPIPANWRRTGNPTTTGGHANKRSTGSTSSPPRSTGSTSISSTSARRAPTPSHW